MYKATIKAYNEAGELVQTISTEDSDDRFAAFLAVERMNEDAAGAYADSKRVIELVWMP